MLETDVGDEIGWRQFQDVGDAFGYLDRAQTSKKCHQFHSVANILKLSPT